MVEIKFAADIVHLVIFDGKYYIDAIDEVFPNERKTFQSSNISVLLAKHTIKHYFLYENIINELKVNLTPKQKCLAYVVLTNIFYVKVLNKNNCVSYLDGELPADEFVKLSPIFKRKEPLEDLISFDKDSNFYYATKYNVPVWLIHMWRKHFGDDYIKEFLEASMNYELQSYVVNTLKTTTDRLLLKYPDFSSPFEDMLLYKGTKRYETTPEFKNDEYIDVKLGFKTMIDANYNEFEEVLVYSGYDNDFVKAGIIKSNRKQSVNVAVPDLNKRAELMRFIRMNDVHNVNLFEAKDEYSFKAGLSYKVDLVVVFPKSTRYDIVTKYPDYLLHVDREELDSLIEGEKQALELCSNYVVDGGALVYVVNTLNKKESTLLVQEFLEKHPEFEFDGDEQMIASHPFATTMYVARMIRKESSND